MLSPFNMNPLYAAWVNSQEAMLRRVINRNCTVIQYRYFLVFLLLANDVCIFRTFSAHKDRFVNIEFHEK